MPKLKIFRVPTFLSGLSIQARQLRGRGSGVAARILNNRGTPKYASSEAIFDSRRGLPRNEQILAELEREATKMTKFENNPVKTASVLPKTQTPTSPKITDIQSIEKKNVPSPFGDKTGSEYYMIRRNEEEKFMRDITYQEMLKKTKDSVNFLEVTKANQHQIIKKVVSPFAHLDYDQQLALKQQRNEAVALHILKMSGQVCENT